MFIRDMSKPYFNITQKVGVKNDSKWGQSRKHHLLLLTITIASLHTHTHTHTHHWEEQVRHIPGNVCHATWSTVVLNVRQIWDSNNTTLKDRVSQELTRDLCVGGDSNIHNVWKVAVTRRHTKTYSGVGQRWVKRVWAFQFRVMDCHLNN